VSEAEMRAYLEHFHDVYREVATTKLPEDLRSRLARFSQLSRGYLGYVSTQFGAGFEYIDEPGLKVIRGSSRIEDLVFDAPRALRGTGPMFKIGGSALFSLSDLTLDGGFPVRLVSERASVRLLRMRARAGYWVRNVEWVEMFGDRSSKFWSVEMATRRALEELLTSAVDVREMERRDLDLGTYLQRYRQHHVLLLGDFHGGRERLTGLGSEIDKMGYVPILADQIPDISEQSLRQKILGLLLACRFVIVEDSTAAGQLNELALLPALLCAPVLFPDDRGDHSRL
jgi:hypothetical protein